MPGADLVVDASAAVRLALADAFGSLRPRSLAAPSLIASEVASALRQLEQRGELSPADVDNALGRFEAATIELHASAGLVRSALEQARRLGWAKTYDAEYVALALRLGVPLLTLDARLQRGVGDVVATVDPLDLG